MLKSLMRIALIAMISIIAIPYVIIIIFPCIGAGIVGFIIEFVELFYKLVKAPIITAQEILKNVQI